MGSKLVRWMIGTVFFLIVLGIAMQPLEGDGISYSPSTPTVSVQPTPGVLLFPSDVVEIPDPAPEQSASPEISEEPEVDPEPTPEVVPIVTPEVTPEITPEITPEPTPEPIPEPVVEVEHDYILNVNSLKFHYPDCKSVSLMNESSKLFFTGTREEAMAKGYVPCMNCNP